MKVAGFDAPGGPEVLRLTDAPDAPVFQTAEAWTGRIAALEPQPWLPVDLGGWAAVLEGEFDTYWLSDGLAREGQEALFARLEDAGEVTVFQSPRPRAGESVDAVTAGLTWRF